jgi:SAM-dependent methyltransferase
VEFEDAARAVAARYTSRPAHWYVRSKLAIDPVGRALLDLGAARGGFGDVADVACGRGQMALLLREANVAANVTGIDWDDEKIGIARSAAAGLWGVSFARADVCGGALPSADTVLLIDILHYLSRGDQDALLVRAARAARREVIVRDVDPHRGMTSVVTHGWERVTTALGYNRGARVAPRAFDDIGAILEAEGFAVSRRLCSAWGMSNVLLIGQRSRPR